MFNILGFGIYFLIFYSILEAREVSRNLPDARAIIFPKYEPVASHGDPIQELSDVGEFSHVTPCQPASLLRSQMGSGAASKRWERIS